MRIRSKILLRAVVFCLIVCLGILYLTKVFFADAETYQEVRGFYSEPENSLDVLFVGASSCVRAVSPIKMWEEYGFTSYSLATTLQPPVYAYEILKNALKRQQPKVVVLFCDGLWQDYDYTREGQFRGAVDGMRLSWEKWETVNYICARDKNQSRISYWVPFFRYHDRWDELEKEDFEVSFAPVHSYRKGQRPLFAISETPVEERPEKEGPLPEYCEESLEFFQKAVDLCKERNIDVVIVKGYKQTGWNMLYSKSLEQFAAQNGCPCLDYNYGDFAKELDIEYPWDYCDTGHLNYYGALKFSEHLGGYLKEHYDLPDDHDLQICQQWNEDRDMYYVQNLRADIVLEDHEIGCYINGLDDVEGLNLTYQFYLYRNGRYVEKSAPLSEGDYTFEITESGTYRVRVYVYAGEEKLNRFTTSLLEVEL